MYLESDSSPSATYVAKEPKEKLGDAILHLYMDNSQSHFVIELYDEFDITIKDEATGVEIPSKESRTPRSYAARSFVERRFKHGYRAINRKGCTHPIYLVPITDYSVHVIQNGWTGTKRISDAAKPHFQKIFLREFLAEANAKRTAEFRFQKTVPSDPWFEKHDALLHQKGIDYLGEPLILSPYQKVAAYNCCKSKGYGLFLDMGLGKTCIMIRKLDYIIDHANRPTISVIFCPKSVRSNWVDEIKKFSANVDKIFIHILSGTNGNDRVVNFINAISSDEAYLIDGTQKHIVIICGYEAWVTSPKLWDKENGLGLEYDLALLDEAHSIANMSTKRTKTFLTCRDIFANRVIATGTPFCNSPFDIYAQLEFIGEGVSGFDSFQKFKEFYGEYEDPRSCTTGVGKLVGFQRIPLLQEKVAKYTFVMKKEEALPYLPKKTYSTLSCNLTREQLKAYIQLCEQLTAVIDSYGPEPDTITVNNILTQMLRLAQITSGFAATDAGTISRFDPNPKLELLTTLLKGGEFDGDEYPGILSNPDSKVIIWTVFKENIKMIKARLALEGIEVVIYHGDMSDEAKDDAKRRFNCDRSCRILCGIEASGGVGLNLVGFDPLNASQYTTNCDNVIFYSSNWSWKNHEQAANRAHRHNTRVPVHCTSLIVPNSIDVEIFERLRMKGEMSTNLQDLKNILLARIPFVNGN